MATGVKTTEFVWDTLLTNLATNTTLGTATRHDFGAVTLYIPESSPVFLSVVVEVTVRDAFSAARNWTGWRIGIKLGAVAFTDTDYTPNAQSNTSDHETFRFIHDVTGYFTANWSGTSMTSQVGVAFATSVADNVNNITAKIRITYQYDDSSGTHIKTVRIPIQGELGFLPTSKTEIGCSGASAAPANQIPALDTFLPEGSKTIRQAWIEVFANDAGSPAATNFNAFYEIDSAGEATRATLVQTNATATWFKDIWIYDTSTHSTASAHSFNARSSLASRLQCMGAVLHVTYEYDPSSATHLNSILVVLSKGLQLDIPATTSASADVQGLELWVEEPTTITLVQSGVYIEVGSDFATTFRVFAGTQAERSYVFGNLVYSGPQPVIHRCDQGTGPWSLARGYNKVLLTNYATTVQTAHVNQVMAIVNYTSGRAAAGPRAHNHSTYWFGASYPTSGTLGVNRSVTAASQRWPSLANRYFLNNFAMQTRVRQPTAQVSGTYALKLNSGELQGAGYDPMFVYFTTDTELCSMPAAVDITGQFNQTDQSSGKMDVETARDLDIKLVQTSMLEANYLLTHHEITFSVAGTLSSGTVGATVQAINTYDNKIAGSAVSTGGGAFDVTVYDSANQHYAVCESTGPLDGRSANATPA